MAEMKEIFRRFLGRSDGCESLDDIPDMMEKQMAEGEKRNVFRSP